MYIKRLLRDVEDALSVIERLASRKELGVEGRYALRYAIIEAVEALALISQRLARALDYPLEGYVDSMKFLSRIGVVEENVAEDLARLRNLLVHKYSGGR